MNPHTFTPQQHTALLDLGFTRDGNRMVLYSLFAVPSLACPGTVFLLDKHSRFQCHAVTEGEIRAFVERFVIPVEA